MIHGVDDRIPRVAYTIDEAAVALAVSPRTVTRMLKRRNQRPFHIGRAVQILVAGLEKYTRAEAMEVS